MKWVYNDGGRFAAGYQYHVNDCVCRALSIVTERPYREVQRRLKTLDAGSAAAVGDNEREWYIILTLCSRCK